MSFPILYRMSFYTMLFLATLTLSVDLTDSPIAMLYPLAVAITGIAALLTVDRGPRRGLPRGAANALAVLACLITLVEWFLKPDALIPALGHWLVYLQLVKMLLPKTSEDDWFLFLLGLGQVLVGAVISQSDHVGSALFTWAVLTLWVLALFSLHRDALRCATWPGSGSPAKAEEPDRDVYPGLLNLPFVLSAFRVTLTTLALGGVIFLAMPRRAGMAARNQGNEGMARHLTGFDDEVQLGQMGEILENDSVVMSVMLYDENERRVSPPPETLWRGVTMTDYERGRWHRQRRAQTTLPFTALTGRKMIRQEIKLEASDSPVLFAMRPVLIAEGPVRNPVMENRIDGTIFRIDSRSSTYDYRVLSDRDQTLPQPGERAPDAARRESLLRVPETLRPRLESIAGPVVAAISPENVVERARALENHLREGAFTYTLRMNVVDPNLDPVEDFLVNRKEGHCEFFASALTLLLRSVGIPARMVNGFKGGDWNELAEIVSVRQKHAHSWVEAYVGDQNVPGPESERHPNWLVLDPTPGIERERLVASVGGFSTNFRQATDLVRYIWVFYVVGYNPERQRRILYDPIIKLAGVASRGFRMMGQALRDAASDLLYFQNVEQFISLRGLVVSFGAMLILVGLFFALRWGWRRCRRWYRGSGDDPAALAAGVVFYRRLVQMLAAFGLERPSAETQQEFARRAGVFLTGHGASTEAVADVPRLVVEAFYQVRFGQSELEPGTLSQLEARLDALESSLLASRE